MLTRLGSLFVTMTILWTTNLSAQVLSCEFLFRGSMLWGRYPKDTYSDARVGSTSLPIFEWQRDNSVSPSALQTATFQKDAQKMKSVEDQLIAEGFRRVSIRSYVHTPYEMWDETQSPNSISLTEFLGTAPGKEVAFFFIDSHYPVTPMALIRGQVTSVERITPPNPSVRELGAPKFQLETGYVSWRGTRQPVVAVAIKDDQGNSKTVKIQGDQPFFLGPALN